MPVIVTVASPPLSALAKVQKYIFQSAALSRGVGRNCKECKKMSVVKNKRTLSRLEFYNNARKLRADLTNFLLRDFGVRDKVWKDINEDGKEIVITEKYPEWIIENFRHTIITSLNNLMANIVAANSIYPVTIQEVDYRRILQDKAIGNCEQLFQELVFCADILPLSLSKFEPYAEVIDKEIALLKGWRKQNNEIRYKILAGKIKGGSK